MRTDGGEIAVALHDVEPATFERCALIRDWLDDQGIDRVTLLVVPAPDLHPIGDRSADLVAWLEERRRRGDAIAQHGLRDRCSRRGRRAAVTRAQRPDAEFAGLDLGETRRAVEAGWRVLRLAGLEPKGFVAPAYAYTPALHVTLASRFSWWAGQTRLYHAGGSARGTPVGPALAPGERPCVHRLVSPWLVRARAATAGSVLRLDISPRDLEPRRVGAVEAVLEARPRADTGDAGPGRRGLVLRQRDLDLQRVLARLDRDGRVLDRADAADQAVPLAGLEDRRELAAELDVGAEQSGGSRRGCGRSGRAARACCRCRGTASA